jgi:ketosteroid isomerase-like protein
VALSDDPRVQRVIDTFEHLSAADLDRLDRLYTADAVFKDPCNDVRGVAAIRRIFSHMFEAFDAPRFRILQAIVQGDQCFLTWDFEFRLRRRAHMPMTIHGGSHLVFAADGRIGRHRDYWDPAEELYEKLPGLGALMRWLKKRASA